MGQEFWSSLTGWFWLRVSHEVAINMLAGLQSSEGLMGEESASKLTHMAAARDVVCLPWELLCRTVHDMAAGFPQSEWSRGKARRKPSALCPNLESHTVTSVLYSLEVSHSGQPTGCGRESRLHFWKGGMSKSLWASFSLSGSDN